MILRRPNFTLFPYTTLFRSSTLSGMAGVLGCVTGPPNLALQPIGPAASALTGERLLSRPARRSEEHTSELQSHSDLVCRLLLEKKKNEGHGQGVGGAALLAR